MAHIQDEKMILRYHQFNTEDIRVITKTLIVCNDLFFFHEKDLSCIFIEKFSC
jgi:hypothetical protein